MRILFVLGHPNPFPGAAWARIGFIANAFSRKGQTVEVLGAFSPRSFQKRGVARLERITSLNLVFNLNLVNPVTFIMNSLTSLLVALIVLLIRRPDLVAVSVPPGDVGLGAIIASRVARSRCIVDVRDQWEDFAVSLSSSYLRRGFFRLVKRVTGKLYAECELVLGVTAPITAALKSRGIMRTRLLPNGADLATFRPKVARRRSKHFTIVYVGHIGDYYPLEFALQALKRLRDMGASRLRIVIAGDGDVEGVFRDARRLGISSSVIYKGVITDKRRLASIIALAQVGLVPYDDNRLWRNTVPAKFFEYCACGLPVIATTFDDSVLATLIRQNAVGLVVPPVDVQGLLMAINKMYTDSVFRTRAARNARELALREFDRQKLAERFLRYVKSSTENTLG